MTTAGQIDLALAAGLTCDEMVALVIARHGWWVCGRLDPATVTDDLRAALASPAAVAWDGIFTRRARAELSVASVPVPRRP